MTRPSFITIMRCDRSRATARSWVTTIAASPRLGDEAAQQVEQARLHRNVEAAGRLVHEHQSRTGHQIAGDLQALAHAAGIGARLVVDAVALISTRPSQSIAGVADLAVVAVADRHQALADIGAGADTVMRRPSRRVLVHEPPFGA